MAQQFNISSQTLRRKLKREDCSYPQIKNEIRRNLALEKLLIQKLSISEIVHTLGYSESRSCTPAFKVWTRRTPTNYLL
ncbi:helix-turn-helix domain-containing protein [Amphritea sp.]|uniref:helix-turn-helix domain-containing protein n=1 Tax=Amphritea sp. TaxID=1872502 RepID=UPI003A95A90D